SSLVAKGVTVTGQVLQSPYTRLITPAHSWHYVWAQRLASMGYSRWTVALLTGNRQNLETADWALLRVTGTAHLFSISGMHVGVVALWTSLFAGIFVAILLLARRRNYNGFNIQPQVLSIALIVSGGYATLANWQVPVSRAWICFGILSVLWLSGRYWTWLQRYLVMVASCILLFPFSVFGTSFYLSAGAVALLILLTWRFKPPGTSWLGRFKYVCKLQFTLSLVLVPVTAVFFNSMSLLVAPVNLIAIPWITMIVPVGLAGLVVAALTGTPNVMLDITDEALTALVAMLNGVQPFMLSYEKLPFSPGSMICGFLALILVALPCFAYRWRCCLTLTLPLFSHLVPPSSRDWHLHIFDVGQGNAMLISKGAQGVLIDTGPSYETSDAYTRIIKPALTQLGIDKIDRIMVTHGDDDHAGGLFSAKVDRLNTHGLAPVVMTNTDACTQGNDFNWQGLDFHILWPARLNHVDGNGYSCVFTVTDGVHTTLFPGDINKSVEYELLYNNAYLKSDVLVAPHHGSNTSSSDAFIYAVAPAYTVFSTGYYHRWRLPHRDVVARYQQYGMQMVNTSRMGYTRFSFNNKEIVTYAQGAGINQRWYDSRWYRPSAVIDNH
ncbi:DNA internalization-related competence protein ComEC/Rec2, partial [Alteromonas sp. 14N.309.X.WAT.G.H12]|uniref:DNA internalization-related competence protein ComEC/Rec2 n=1 Tax=Alteromonas sp. 14N.309.X.WAT.G.H12 TaxID=3120824 RepID=UPI002FCED1B5